MLKKTLFFLPLLLKFIWLPAQSERRLVLLYTNDMHSRLTGFGPESYYTPLTTNDDSTTGGFARIATIIKEEKERNGERTLVLDAGDFLMGTLFQHLEPKSGFQLPLMRKMGYDVVCIGNHEFDYGPGKLAEIVTSSSKNGELPVILLGNAVFSDKDSNDDSLEELYKSEKILRKFILTRNGIKTGFFSLMGKVADDNAAYATPVTFSKQIPFAKRMVKELRNEGCELIICLSHSGIDPDKKGGWTGEDVELARKVKGIDVIISGHTHTLLDKPLIVNGIPIVQAGDYGRYVGRLSLKLEGGKVTIDSSSLYKVDDKIQGDPFINASIDKQKKAVADDILRPIGMEYEKSIAETDFTLTCDEQGDVENSNLGPLVADAIHSYVNNHTAAGTDVSMVAVGIIREKILRGIQTAPDIFRVMSMGTGNDNVPGYPLSRVYMTGKELKSMLEILNIAWKSTPGNYCYYSGIKVSVDSDGGLLKKIKKIEIAGKDGALMNVDFSKKKEKLYSVTASSYLLQYIGIIKKKSFGLINVVPKDFSGMKIVDMKNAVIDFDDNKNGIQEGKEWVALVEYLRSMQDTNGNGIPDIAGKYRNPVKSFSQVNSK